MRNNQPVNGVEQPVRDGESIVSKTDLKGLITYCNPYFMEVSGFEEQELIGSPHNILRHPDMPAAAFADMWTTIKAGQQWTGIVKNRCKNGNHYWVRANVTPLVENGQVTGYLSVRTKPLRSEIEVADKLYRSWQQGQSQHIELHRGVLRERSLLGKLRAWQFVAAQTKLALAMSLLIAINLLWLIRDWISAGPGWFSGLSAVFASAIILSVWRFSSSHLLAPIQQALDTTKGLAGGDLSHRTQTGDASEFGQLLQALHQLNINLIAMIGDVRANVQAIIRGTQEIADGNLELSNRTESQANSLQRTASSMSEFAATVRQNYDNAKLADQMASSTSQVAHQAGLMVEQLGQTMLGISEAAKRIENIISLIDGIAFQTNILALNAAVEAARAGEQGRGFAVVASEVRNLAQRSAGAAKEIKDLIEDSVNQVRNGNQLVGQTGQLMQQLVQAVNQVSQVINEISLATDEQSKGIDEVNQAIHNIDEVTQQNTAMVEESAAAAANLASQAQQLGQAVSVFKMAASDAAKTHAVTSYKSNQLGNKKRNTGRNYPLPRLNNLQTD